jgi:hypothetical protein
VAFDVRDARWACDSSYNFDLNKANGRIARSGAVRASITVKGQIDPAQDIWILQADEDPGAVMLVRQSAAVPGPRAEPSGVLFAKLRLSGAALIPRVHAAHHRGLPDKTSGAGH